MDYDLFVYRSCNGSPVATSRADETITARSGDAFAKDDDFDYWVEVRFFGGASCSQWTPSSYGHDCGQVSRDARVLREASPQRVRQLQASDDASID